MSAKTIFIIILTALITLVLVNNTDEMELWLFGITKISKLAVLGTVLAFGFGIGFIAASPRKKTTSIPESERVNNEDYISDEKRSDLSDEDREYIS